MYIIHSSPRQIKKIREYLKKTGSEFRDTKLDDYLLVRENPEEIVPRPLLRGAWVKQTDEYVTIIKEYGELAEFFERTERKPPQQGDVVAITRGEYRGLNLRGVVLSAGKRTCMVQVTVFGNLVQLQVGMDDVEVIERKEE